MMGAMAVTVLAGNPMAVMVGTVVILGITAAVGRQARVPRVATQAVAAVPVMRSMATRSSPTACGVP